MQNITISRATIDDAEGIQILTAISSKGMYELCGWSEKEIQNHFSPEIIKSGTNKLKENIAIFSDSDILFVAKDNNKIVGYCYAEKQKDINRIEAVFILPEFQGIGLAKKLYNEAYKYLNQFNKTFLEVFSSNSKAIGFYEKMGFVDTGKKVYDKRFVNSKGEILPATEMMLASKE
jgi:ribosomal protein S18 acetylase RimI-like enzyme